jgi:hypothetical protein
VAILIGRRFVRIVVVVACLALGVFLGVGEHSPLQRATKNTEPTADLLQLASSAAVSMLRDRFLCLVDGDTSRLTENYGRSTASGDWAWEREVYRVEYFRDWASKRGVIIVEADSEFEIDAVSSQGDGSVWIEVTELACYSYVYADDEMGPKFTFGSRAVHAMEVQEADGRWVISMDWYLDPLGESCCITASEAGEPDSCDVQTYWATGSDALHGVWPMSPLTIASNRLDAEESRPRFNRSAAVQYALAHSGVRSIEGAGKYNSAYRTYTYAGGDCASFVSQVLHAGGMEQGYGWYYTTEGSTAWVRSDGLVWYLLSSGRGETLYRGKFAKAVESTKEHPQGIVSALELGDVIAYETRGEISHVAVVVGKDPRGYVTIASHTADRLYFPWDLGWDRDTVYWLITITY